MQLPPPVPIIISAPPVTAIVTPAKSNALSYIVVILLMVFVTVTSIVAITLLHPGDNIQLDVMIVGFSTTTIGVIIAFLKSEQSVQAVGELHVIMNSRLTEWKAETLAATLAAVDTARNLGRAEGSAAAPSAVPQIAAGLPLGAQPPLVRTPNTILTEEPIEHKP